MCSLNLLALKDMKACKNRSACFVILYFQTHIWRNLSCKITLKTEMVEQLFQNIMINHWNQKGSFLNSELSNFGFVSAGKPLLMAFYYVVYNAAKSNRTKTIAKELIKAMWTYKWQKFFLKKKASKKLLLLPYCQCY